MADLSKSKKNIHATFPENTIASAESFETMSPIYTGKDMRENFLFGIPMTAPLTGERMTDKMLDKFVKRAISLVETESKIDLQPRIKRVRLPFHPKDYIHYIHLEIPHKPIRKVVSISISAANYADTPDANADYPNGLQLYKMPLEWVDMAMATRGVLNINPFSPAFSPVGAAVEFGTAGATPITHFLGQMAFIPGFWNVEVLTGVACEKTGNIPLPFNELVGMKAAMLAIDNLIPIFRVSSQSMGVDGLSQSVNDNLFKLLQDKRQQLEKDYDTLMKALKTNYSQRFFMTTV